MLNAHAGRPLIRWRGCKLALLPLPLTLPHSHHGLELSPPTHTTPLSLPPPHLPPCCQAHYRDYNQMTFARCVFVIHNMAHQVSGWVGHAR